MRDTERRRQSFGAWANQYDQLRPAYPQELVAAILDDCQATVEHPVVDIGAGTGQLTRVIDSLGFPVVAVEPDERMRALLARGLGEQSALAGSAEDIPLQDGAAAAVLGGQMWHWVRPEAAVPEIGRVLRPGGSMTIVWILRDDRVGWVRELAEVVSLPDRLSWFDGASVPSLGDPFGPFVMREQSFTQDFAVEQLPDHLRTYSSVALADDVEDQLAAAVRIVAEHPEAGVAGVVEMPFVAKAFSARRR